MSIKIFVSHSSKYSEIAKSDYERYKAVLQRFRSTCGGGG